MRVTAETHRTHGAALLRAASRLFRARGVGAVSIAEVSAESGLTHGAFYGHFASKAALAEAACRDVMANSSRVFRARAAAARAAGGSGLEGIIAAYLTEQHRDLPREGCLLATLGPELVRGEPGVRAAYADGTATLADILAEEIARLRPDLPSDACQAKALGVLATLAGGLLVARALTDPGRSRIALAAAAQAARAAAAG